MSIITSCSKQIASSVLLNSSMNVLSVSTRSNRRLRNVVARLAKCRCEISLWRAGLIRLRWFDLDLPEDSPAAAAVADESSGRRPGAGLGKCSFCWVFSFGLNRECRRVLIRKRTLVFVIDLTVPASKLSE